MAGAIVGFRILAGGMATGFFPAGKTLEADRTGGEAVGSSGIGVGSRKGSA